MTKFFPKINKYCIFRYSN